MVGTAPAKAIGGQLELLKCFYYLLHWVFDSEGRHGSPHRRNLADLLDKRDDKDIDITQ
jgi:hypothetical protein